MIKIIPKIGPASYLAIKIPDAQTEGWYIQSVNRSADNYRRLLERLRANPTMTLDLPNRDLDTGARVKAGDYALTDDTYAALVDRSDLRPVSHYSRWAARKYPGVLRGSQRAD